MVRLSEQQMIDCTWNIKGVWKDQGNHGCHGGMAWKVFFWAKSGNTLATSKSYGAYRGQVLKLLRGFLLSYIQRLTCHTSYKDRPFFLPAFCNFWVLPASYDVYMMFVSSFNCQC